MPASKGKDAILPGPAMAKCIPVPDRKAGTEPREESIEPCILVILGATGDLTSRKLMPALFHLYLSKRLPQPFSIVGCGRTVLDDDQFRGSMSGALHDAGLTDREDTAGFLSSVHYLALQYDDLASFERLAAYLGKLDREICAGHSTLFYLALPPALYAPVVEKLGQVRLASGDERGRGRIRLVVEKPFGRDLASAVKLDRTIHEYFQEKQIFRIDHYLAKETVQNILMFRFANAIFEPLWNRRYIDSVRISATETLGVEHRAGYYEQTGVVRDMFQNHMMQLLALTAMEPPSVFEAERVRDEKIKVHRSLRPFQVDAIKEDLILGQYESGTINGQKVLSYRKEQGVADHSLTPTYAMMKLYVENWRWQGVPFFLVSGKRLAEKKSEISIRFKPVPHSMFSNILGGKITANQLILGIYPDERIKLTFQTKTPGARLSLQSVVMDFHYQERCTDNQTEAYEKVLLDCMLGDQMLFWRQDGVEACWAFLTPILSECESCSDKAKMLHFYESGRWGPSAAEKILNAP
ncbi:MAG: glucose-6-phosphate dehydrogenase [Desulfobacterales bacterium]|nr:glucose-6-phosphate dehydrogenase [Desulfobacterales bacterium]